MRLLSTPSNGAAVLTILVLLALTKGGSVRATTVELGTNSANNNVDTVPIVEEEVGKLSNLRGSTGDQASSQTQDHRELSYNVCKCPYNKFIVESMHSSSNFLAYEHVSGAIPTVTTKKSYRNFKCLDAPGGKQYIQNVDSGKFLRARPDWGTGGVDFATWSDKGEEWCIKDTGAGYWTIKSVPTKQHLRLELSGVHGIVDLDPTAHSVDAYGKFLIHNACTPGYGVFSLGMQADMSKFVSAPGNDRSLPGVMSDSNNVWRDELFTLIPAPNGNQYIKSIKTNHYLRNWPESDWNTNTVDMAAAASTWEEWCISDTGHGYWTIESVLSNAHLRFNNAKDGLDLVSANNAASDENARFLIYNRCGCPRSSYETWTNEEDCFWDAHNGNFECNFHSPVDFRCEQNDKDPNYQSFRDQNRGEYLSTESKAHIAMRPHKQEDEAFCVVEVERNRFSMLSRKYPGYWLYGAHGNTHVVDTLGGWEMWWMY